MKSLKTIALSAGLTLAFCSASYAIEDDRYDDYPPAAAPAAVTASTVKV